MAAPLILCRDLVKTFGPTRALDGLSLTVEAGEVHGFLGPNGAGKTVTLRTILGLLRADSGTIRVFDADPWDDAVELHRRLAYVPGETNLWPNLTGGEIIDVLGSLRGGLDDDRRNDLVERFRLDPTKKARAYSKGNKQKVSLVAALASDAELLLLDEPTSGLDPLMEAEFQECIAEARRRGCTVLLSSHILAEVEQLCERVTIIREGRTVETGSLAEMRRLTRTSFAVTTRQSAASLAMLDGVHGFHVDEGVVRFEADTDAVDDVVEALAPLGVISLVSNPPTLEQLFLRQYGGEE